LNVETDTATLDLHNENTSRWGSLEFLETSVAFILLDHSVDPRNASLEHIFKVIHFTTELAKDHSLLLWVP
jgi:hypothetical protein